MTYTKSHNNNGVTVVSLDNWDELYPIGAFGTPEAAKASKSLLDSLKSGGQVLIDLSQVKLLGETGLSIFMVLYRKAVELGATVKFFRAQLAVERKLIQTQICTLMQVLDSKMEEKDAVLAF